MRLDVFVYYWLANACFSISDSFQIMNSIVFFSLFQNLFVSLQIKKLIENEKSIYFIINDVHDGVFVFVSFCSNTY